MNGPTPERRQRVVVDGRMVAEIRTECPHEMPAGRELDALVAEKVLGIMPREVRVRGETNTVTVWSDNPALYDGQWLRGALEQYGAPRPYSTDIAAAWTVVEKLSGFDGDREKPWWSVAVFHAQQNQVMAVVYANEPGWRVDDTDERIAEGHGWTAPEAICRAALAACTACGRDVRRVPSGRDHQPVRCGGTEET